MDCVSSQSARNDYSYRSLFIEIGKFRPNVGAHIGYANNAILVIIIYQLYVFVILQICWSKVKQCELLIGSFSAIQWIHVSSRLNLKDLGACPVEGGHEANGELLFIARGQYKGGVHPGKAGAHLGGAFITYGKHEQSIHVSTSILRFDCMVFQR